MKIRPVGAELSHADGLTQSEASSRFLQFCKSALKDKNTFDGFNTHLHGFSDFVLYRPANPLFGDSPTRLFHLFQLCHFPFLSVSHIPFVANFPREFQVYYD